MTTVTIVAENERGKCFSTWFRGNKSCLHEYAIILWDDYRS